MMLHNLLTDTLKTRMTSKNRYIAVHLTVDLDTLNHLTTILFIAAHDKANNKYEYCTKEFATQKQGKENNNEIFLGEIEVESLSSNTVSLSVPVRNADTLTYHICEGDSCNCISSDIEAGMTDIEFNNYRSFIALGYASFEIEGLKPNTTYHITVNGYNRISTAHKEITFTTAQ